MIKAIFVSVCVAAAIAPLPTWAQQTIPISPGQPTTCSGFHEQMCMNFCRTNRNSATLCTDDCDRRLQVCLGQGNSPFSKTHAGYYLWGGKYVGNLTKE